MFEITVRVKIGGTWETLPVPEKLTDKIEFISEMAGKESVIKIQNSLCERYLCGTPDLVSGMKKKFPDALVMDAGEAYMMIQYQPEIFFVSVETFFGPKEVKVLFPDKPIIAAGKGWDHLKENP